MCDCCVSAIWTIVHARETIDGTRQLINIATFFPAVLLSLFNISQVRVSSKEEVRYHNKHVRYCDFRYLPFLVVSR